MASSETIVEIARNDQTAAVEPIWVRINMSSAITTGQPARVYESDTLLTVL